jgi:NAD dependent epimerase/dehydratase family enzyme
MRVIRREYGYPFGLPAPEWLLNVGAIVIGTETELLLKSRWVMPKRLLDSEFEFQFERAWVAVREILSEP